MTQLEYMADRYRFLAPDSLESFLRGNLRPDRYLLLTFDDGIKNQLIAARCLERLGARGVFFVVPGFVDAVDQYAYFRSNIRDQLIDSVHGTSDDVSAMDWSDIRNLRDRGHEIGSHSMTHMLVASQSTAATRQMEIAGSKEAIERRIEGDVLSFCGPVSSRLSVGAPEMSLIEQNYRFFHSGIAGANTVGDSRWFLKRANVEVFWDEDLFRFSLSRMNEIHWSRARRRFGRDVVAAAYRPTNRNGAT